MTLTAERALLIPILDALVPPSGDFPGAGSVSWPPPEAPAS